MWDDQLAPGSKRFIAGWVLVSSVLSLLVAVLGAFVAEASALSWFVLASLAIFGIRGIADSSKKLRTLRDPAIPIVEHNNTQR